MHPLLFVPLLNCKETNRSVSEIENTTVIITGSVKSRIDSILQSFVASGNITGVSALIFEKDREVCFGTIHEQDTPHKSHNGSHTMG